MSLTSAYDAFSACAGTTLMQNVQGVLDDWRKNINPAIAANSPAASGLVQQLQGVDRMLCLNSFLDQEVVAAQAATTGLLAGVDACIADFWSPEAHRVKLGLEDALAHAADALATTGALGVQLAARKASLELKRSQLAAQATSAVLLSDVLDPFVVGWRADRALYTVGEVIHFDLTTTGAHEVDAAQVSVVRPDLEPPSLDDVPDTAHARVHSQLLRVAVQAPPDFRAGAAFRVRFVVRSLRKDFTQFFVHFDRVRPHHPGPVPPYRVRC